MYAWVIAGSLVVGAPALKEKREPDKPPDGKWEMERFVHKGKSWSVATLVWLDETAFAYTDGALMYERYKPTFFRVGRERRADLATTPGSVSQAIWKVEDDRLTICIGATGEARPTAYTAPPDSGRVLIILKRTGD